MTITRHEGAGALFKGLRPALIGMAPYAALNFASYDLLKRSIFGADARCPAALSRLQIAFTSLAASLAALHDRYISEQSEELVTCLRYLSASLKLLCRLLCNSLACILKSTPCVGNAASRINH